MTASSGWVGRPLARLEDVRFLTGAGRFLDDIEPPGTLHAAFVRSPHAAARLVGVDRKAALAVPGVVAVLTGAETAAAGLAFTGEEMYGYRMPVLAEDVVRYVGEPVALVVARSRYAAEDGAAALAVTYERRPAVVDPEVAVAGGPAVHEGRPNVFFHQEFRSEGFDELFAAAPRRLRLRVRTHRQTATSIEPRGCLALWEGPGAATLYLSTQSPHNVRAYLAPLFGLGEARLRVVAPDVGGAFGMKAAIYPEEVAVLAAARLVGRPVKWVADRRESLLADVHARDDIHDLEVAFAEDGRILAVRDHLVADSGAYPAFPFSGAVGETTLAARILTGPYAIRGVAYTIDCVLTHKTPLGAYRGVWGPIASLVQEGMVDRVAAELGLDPALVRRRNLIDDRSAADGPYVTPTGLAYGSGSYRSAMEEALAAFDYEGFRRRQAKAREEGRLIGVGISVFVEPTAFAGSEAGEVPYESCLVRVEPSGEVVASLGLGPSGQGHATAMAQVVADALGVRPEDVQVGFGDTGAAPFGGGTGGSRSAVAGGGAAHLAAVRLADKVRRIAAHLLEAAPQDVRLAGGRAFVEGVPGRGVSLREVAEVAYRDVARLPEGEEPGLEALGRYRPEREITFSNGCHVAEVEVDPETGRVTPRRYVVVNDCGRLLNPLVVEGQIHGGVAQGVGSAFLEELIHDADGQLTTTTLLDYRLPTALDVPPVAVRHLVSPSEHPLGVKGMAEGPLIAAPAAFAGAVRDALGVALPQIELPLTPERVLRLVREEVSGRG